MENKDIMMAFLTPQKSYIKYKKLSNLAIEPTRGSEEAAGWDLYAALTEDVVIPAGEVVKIPTDIAIQIPPTTFGAIFARSGLATKQGLRPANAVGVVDSDYRGNVIVALYNDSNSSKVVHRGDRIAQLVIIPYMQYDDFQLVDELDETLRGDGGFGSTGSH